MITLKIKLQLGWCSIFKITIGSFNRVILISFTERSDISDNLCTYFQIFKFQILADTFLCTCALRLSWWILIPRVPYEGLCCEATSSNNSRWWISFIHPCFVWWLSNDLFVIRPGASSPKIDRNSSWIILAGILSAVRTFM